MNSSGEIVFADGRLNVGFTPKWFNQLAARKNRSCWRVGCTQTHIHCRHYIYIQPRVDYKYCRRNSMWIYDFFRGRAMNSYNIPRFFFNYRWVPLAVNKYNLYYRDIECCLITVYNSWLKNSVARITQLLDFQRGLIACSLI